MPLFDANDDNVGWQAFALQILDLPMSVQFALNTAFQVMHTAVDNRYWPLMQWIILKNDPITTSEGQAVVNGFQNILTESLRQWMKPNLGGIVIQETSETQERAIDLSENMLIVQGRQKDKNSANKMYCMDNSAPRLRTWSVEGYLTQAMPAIDEKLLLRPSLVAQQMLLDAYAIARRPVLYRSGLCPIPTFVMIENYRVERLLEGTNAYKVSVHLREFVTYKVPVYRPQGDAADFQTTSGQLISRGSAAPVEEAATAATGIQ